VSKQILVTGGAGFIGSNFVNYVLSKYPEYSMTVLDAFTYAGSIENLPEEAKYGTMPRLKVWYGNVCNSELVETLLREVDSVVHFAAESHVTRSIFDNRLFFETDILGTQTIANAIVKAGSRIERFIHVSSSEVYGTAETETMDESHPLNPVSPYAAAKCGADRLVYSYFRTYQLPVVVVRPFNNYGPSQHLEKVIPRFVTSVLMNEPITVHGDGGAARDFVYVDDTCRAIDLLLHAPAEKVSGEVFNVASGVDRTILSVAHDIASLMGYGKDRISFVREDRPGQVDRHTGNPGKIGRIVGWRPAMQWDEGLKRTVEWFRSNQAWWKRQTWLRTVPIRTRAGKVELY
jgi:dTDP-glucose 4,6-dehydratase